MKERKDYSSFSANDFLHDSYFLEWMRKDNVETNAFWEQWESAHPEKRQAVAEAKERYQILVSFEPIGSTAKERIDIWEKIDSYIEKRPVTSKRNILHLRVWGRVAAAVVTLLIMGIWFIYHQNEVQPEDLVVIQSGNEMKKVILSDSSTVFLNRYTTLKYRADNGREFWLEGQAFFDVKHQHIVGNTAVPFLVHAGIEDVTVLGTSFTMKSKDSTAEVILIQGKVKASVKDKAVMMKPGEKTTWEGNVFKSKQVNTQLYLAWKTGEFHFDHTSLEELKELIKDYYGYDLVVENKTGIKDKTVSGTVSAKDEDVLWKTLSLMFHANVKKEGKKIIMEMQ